MARYVDGFLIPLPAKNLDAYRKMARLGARVWKDHGALEYRETVVEDLNPKDGLSFGKAVKLKPGETVILAWVVYKSRAHRDRVLKKVMSDPRLHMDMKDAPFNPRRMFYGGFEVLVEA